jgi:hypothetical protein
LHLVRTEDYAWLHAVTTPPLFTASARRLAQEGVSPGDADRAVAEIERVLADEGPLGRAALRERVAALGIRTERQAMIHILLLASLRGLIVRGPMTGNDHAYVLVRDWLGPVEPVDRDQALAELARRYLAGHAPATDRDLARWAGIGLRDARAGLKAIEVDERDGGLLALPGAPAAAELPPPRLLGSFDPVLLGWTSRDWIAGAEQVVLVRNGIFRAFALVGGRAAGVWGLPAGRVRLDPFKELAAADAAALEADAQDVVRFLAAA